jgi:hypothetical protein
VKFELKIGHDSIFEKVLLPEGKSNLSSSKKNVFVQKEKINCFVFSENQKNILQKMYFLD